MVPDLAKLTKQTLRIVLVENNDDEAFLIERALRGAGFAGPLIRFSDGQEAIDYLSNLEEKDVPHVFLSDLNMPRVNGLEFLKWLRSHPLFHTYPLFLLTSSDRPEDINSAQALGATRFHTKKPGFTNVIRSLEELLVGHLE